MAFLCSRRVMPHSTRKRKMSPRPEPSSKASTLSPMWYFRKTNPFQSLIAGKFVTLVGAGGKTSLAEYLAREAVTRGERVVLTTTTKIWAKEPYDTIDGSRWRDSGE